LGKKREGTRQGLIERKSNKGRIDGLASFEMRERSFRKKKDLAGVGRGDFQGFSKKKGGLEWKRDQRDPWRYHQRFRKGVWPRDRVRAQPQEHKKKRRGLQEGREEKRKESARKKGRASCREKKWGITQKKKGEERERKKKKRHGGGRRSRRLRAVENHYRDLVLEAVHARTAQIPPESALKSKGGKNMRGDLSWERKRRPKRNIPSRRPTAKKKLDQRDSKKPKKAEKGKKKGKRFRGPGAIERDREEGGGKGENLGEPRVKETRYSDQN